MIRWNFNPNAAKDEGGFSMDSPGNPASDRMHLEIRWRNSRIFPSPVFGGSGVQSAAMEAEDAVREMLGSWGPPSLHNVGALVKANMRRELKRLLSLRDWPCPGTVSPQQLARAGFFYLGPSDRVQCFCCGGILRSWEPGDQPDIEHRKFFPSCPFVLGTEVGNVPLPSPAGDTDSVDGQILGQLHRLPGEQQGEDEEDAWRAAYPDLMEERQRMATYRTWPQYTGVSPDLLAAAGFFYTGQRDNVRCFHCDGELRNWERGDDPWREHAKWFPRCEFLVQTMGPAYIRSVQEATGSSPASSPESQRSSDRSPSTSSGSPGHWQDFLQSSIVQEALQMGFDESLVVSLVQSRFLLVGTPYNCLSELVTELVDEAAQAEEESVPLTQEPARIPEGSAQRAASESPKQPGTTLNTEEQLRRLKEERMCKVCMDKDVSMVFVPCGHLVVCMDCAPNLRHCPICRATIRGSMRAFMS